MYMGYCTLIFALFLHAHPAMAAPPCANEVSQRLEAMGMGTWGHPTLGVEVVESAAGNPNPSTTWKSPVAKSSLVFYPKGNPDAEQPLRQAPTVEMKSFDSLRNPTRVTIALNSQCLATEAHVQSTAFANGEFVANAANCRRLQKFQAPTCLPSKERVAKDPTGPSVVTSMNYDLAMSACRELNLNLIGFQKSGKSVQSNEEPERKKAIK